MTKQLNRLQWRQVPLNDVCLKIQDGAHNSPKEQFSVGGPRRYMYVTSKNIRNNFIDLSNVSYVSQDFHDQIYPRCTPEVGDVLLTKDGANTGNVTLNTIAEPFSLLSSVALIKTDPTVLMPEFLSYYLQSPQGLGQITGQMTGTAIKRIILRDLKAAHIPLPPKPEQQRIVAIIDESLEAIAAARANSEQSLRDTSDLFLGNLSTLFAGIWNATTTTKMSDLATDITDGDHMPPPKSKEGVPFVTISNIDKQSRVLDFSDTYFVSRDYFEGLKPNRRPRRGDLLYTVTGSFGIPVKVEDDVEFCFQRHIGLIRPKPDVSTSWLYYLVLSPQLSRQARERATGTAQKTVSLSVLRDFSVPMLSLTKQKLMATKLDELKIETERLEMVYKRKLEALDELKQAVLSSAFSGGL